jgi:hypothetical protein
MKEIIDKLTIIRDKVVSERTDGILRFFGLIARIDLDSKWDLLISADWISKNNNEEDLIYIIKKLKEEFMEHLDFLSRIVVLTSNEFFVKQLARAILTKSLSERGEISNLQISPDFVVKQLYVISFDFNGIDLDAPEIENGPAGVRESANF